MTSEIGGFLPFLESNLPNAFSEYHSSYQFSSSFLTARHALLSLVDHLFNTGLIKGLYLPDFFCLDVTEFLQANTKCPIFSYYDPIYEWPSIPSLDFPILILLSNTFGLKNISKLPPFPSRSPIYTIFDSTHTPLSLAENLPFTYSLISLRKSYALPDGAFLFHNDSGYLSSTNFQSSHYISFSYLLSSILKSLYLTFPSFKFLKPIYLQLFSAHESYLVSNAKLSNLSLLTSILIAYYKLNFKPYPFLFDHSASFANLPSCLTYNKPSTFTIYQAITCSDVNLDIDCLLLYLRDQSIYLPKIWPLAPTSFSRSFIIIPTDPRYNSISFSHILSHINRYVYL